MLEMESEHLMYAAKSFHLIGEIEHETVEYQSVELKQVFFYFLKHQ